MKTSSLRSRIYSILFLVIFTLPKGCFSQSTEVVLLPSAALFRYTHRNKQDTLLGEYLDKQYLEYRYILLRQHLDRQYIRNKIHSGKAFSAQEKPPKRFEIKAHAGTIGAICGMASLTVLLVHTAVKLSNYFSNLKNQADLNTASVKKFKTQLESTQKKQILALFNQVKDLEQKIASLDQKKEN